MQRNRSFVLSMLQKKRWEQKKYIIFQVQSEKFPLTNLHCKNVQEHTSRNKAKWFQMEDVTVWVGVKCAMWALQKKEAKELRMSVNHWQMQCYTEAIKWCLICNIKMITSDDLQTFYTSCQRWSARGDCH